MAALLDEEFNGLSLCDYRLICDISTHRTYKCSNLSCVNTAEFSKMLECDISHHDKSLKLYCLECVQLYQQQDLCPINKHRNPIFQNATQVINFLQFPELNVICPNSLEYKQRKLNNDLQDEDVKEQILATHYNENAGFVQRVQRVQGCEWIGIYKKLLPHINDECKYKPIKCEYIGCHVDDNLSVHSYNKHKKQFVAKHLDIIYQEIKSLKNANQTSLESAKKMDDIMNNIKDKVDENENKINIAKNKQIKVGSNGILSIGVLTAIFVLIISYLLYGKYNYTTERCNERDIDHVNVSEEIIHHILSELNQSSKAQVHEVNGSLLQSELMEMRKIIDVDIKLKDERINELEKSIQILSKQVAGLKPST